MLFLEQMFDGRMDSLPIVLFLFTLQCIFLHQETFAEEFYDDLNSSPDPFNYQRGQSAFQANSLRQSARQANQQGQAASQANQQGQAASQANQQGQAAFQANIQAQAAFHANPQGQAAYQNNAYNQPNPYQYGNYYGPYNFQHDAHFGSIPEAAKDPFIFTLKTLNFTKASITYAMCLGPTCPEDMVID